jgi:hypothetical protein
MEGSNAASADMRATEVSAPDMTGSHVHSATAAEMHAAAATKMGSAATTEMSATTTTATMAATAAPSECIRGN